MNKRIKQIGKAFSNMLPEKMQVFVFNIYRNYFINKIISEYNKSGAPVPPPHKVKQVIIEKLQRKSLYGILVETGTFLGDMIYSQRNNFKKIYSIELGEELWKDAVERFKNDTHITILKGDSGEILKKLILTVEESAIFWLDGHYSEGITARGEKDCPIYEELNAIFSNNKSHIILIDDARCFNGIGDYPEISKLHEFVLKKDARYKMTIEADIIIFQI